MATTPNFAVNDKAYLRESAALGFLEVVRITGLHQGTDGWLYTIATSLTPANGLAYQDRRSLVGTQLLYFSESELLTYCEALALAKDAAYTTYTRLLAQYQAACPDSPTES